MYVCFKILSGLSQIWNFFLLMLYKNDAGFLCVIYSRFSLIMRVFFSWHKVTVASNSSWYLLSTRYVPGTTPGSSHTLAILTATLSHRFNCINLFYTWGNWGTEMLCATGHAASKWQNHIGTLGVVLCS